VIGLVGDFSGSAKMRTYRSAGFVRELVCKPDVAFLYSAVGLD
jgi:hypothetical protein